MPRGQVLTNSERAVILALKEQALSNRLIAKKLKRSSNVVNNFLRSPENYGKRVQKGRPAALSERDKRSILKIASNSMLTARQIVAEAGIQTNVRNVQRLIKKSKRIKRLRIKRKPALKVIHRTRCLSFAKQHLHWIHQWRNVIFSDEKRFNLDGPDGYRYYYHDLRKNKIILSKRQQGGGGVMIWGLISFDGTCEVTFLKGNINSIKYVHLLEIIY